MKGKRRDLVEKCIEVTAKEREVEGGEVREPVEEAREEWDGWVTNSERESETVGIREELFRDKGERLQAAVVGMEKFDHAIPTFIW
jgi:hypothetical protein